MIQLPKQTFQRALKRSENIEALEKGLNEPMPCYGLLKNYGKITRSVSPGREVTVHPHFEPDRPGILVEGFIWGAPYEEPYPWPFPGKNHTASTTTFGAVVGEMVEALS